MWSLLIFSKVLNFADLIAYFSIISYLYFCSPTVTVESFVQLGPSLWSKGLGWSGTLKLNHGPVSHFPWIVQGVLQNSLRFTFISLAEQCHTQKSYLRCFNSVFDQMVYFTRGSVWPEGGHLTPPLFAGGIRPLTILWDFGPWSPHPSQHMEYTYKFFTRTNVTKPDQSHC